MPKKVLVLQSAAESLMKREKEGMEIFCYSHRTQLEGLLYMNDYNNNYYSYFNVPPEDG